MLSRDLIVSQGISITMLVQHFGQGISHLEKNIVKIRIFAVGNPHLLTIAVKVKDIPDHGAQSVVREPLWKIFTKECVVGLT